MRKVKVWDIAVRLFHWVLVILFALSVYSAFQDKFGVYGNMHTWAGISILVLVLWRLFWGLLGSETARFTHFVKGPRAVRAYLYGEKQAGLGHNPLGGWSVILMLLLLLVQAVLGLYATDAMLFSGPLADSIDGDLSEELTEVHEVLGFILMGLVCVHISVVLFYLFFKKLNLILPMITGFQFYDDEVSSPNLRSSWVAAPTLFIIGAGVYWQLF